MTHHAHQSVNKIFFYFTIKYKTPKKLFHRYFSLNKNKFHPFLKFKKKNDYNF